jgi:hypothetical protein
MEMKKFALAVALTAVVGSAQASTFYVDDLGNSSNHSVSFGAFNAPGVPTYTSGSWGALGLNHGSSVKFTALGFESAFADKFVFTTHGQLLKTQVGSSITGYSNAGLLNFYFEDLGRKGQLHDVTFTNGQQQTSVLGFAILKGYGPYKYLLGFNDSSKNDADYDDMVVGVSAVPLPAAAFLFAPALLGFGALRRKQETAA